MKVPIYIYNVLLDSNYTIKMEVTFEFKYIVLIFVYLIDNAWSLLSHTGKEARADRIRSHIVSNAQDYTALHWPKGIVTYYLDNLTYDYFIANRVRMAMNVLESASCVRFKPTLIKPGENLTWIHFTNPQGERNCVHESKLKSDGEIILVLGFDCLKEHEILHTLLHAIGFKDEVSHPQRDQYIRVMWNNIQPEYRYLYRIQSIDEETSQRLVEYDPLSIMHFHDRAFSINGHATVMPLVPGLLINPSDDLSLLDKMRLRLLFDHECNKRKVEDMIDTCKMFVSNNDKPNGSTNISDFKSKENKDDSVNVDNVDNVDKIDNNDEIEGHNETEVMLIQNQDKPNDHSPDKVLNRLLPDKILEQMDKNKETGELTSADEVQGENKGELKLIQNQYDLHKNNPDNKLNRLLPFKLIKEKKQTIESTSVQDYEDAQKPEYDNEN